MSRKRTTKVSRFEFRLEPERARMYGWAVDILRARGQDADLSSWIRGVCDAEARRLIADAKKHGEFS